MHKDTVAPQKPKDEPSPLKRVYLHSMTEVIKIHGNKFTYCGTLNVIGPHKLLGSGTIRRCGLVGGRIVTVGVDFEVYYAQAMPSSAQDINSLLLLQHHVCLHAATVCHDGNELNL